MSDVVEWKKYLQSKNLFIGDVNSSEVNSSFKKGMKALEGIIVNEIPSVKGMIWKGSVINPNAKIADVEEALSLLSLYKKALSLKFGVANFDALGPPGEDQISTIFNQMFISQEDSKLDEYTPENNQNQGRWQNDVPQEVDISKENKECKCPNIDERMKLLTELLDSVKK
jgi:hypothetical protein